MDSYQNTQTRETLSLDYVTCLMKNSLPATGNFPSGPRCAQELQLKNWNVIEQCANTTEGSKLLQHHGETTNALRPELTFVPWINFNQVNYYTRITVECCEQLLIHSILCSNTKTNTSNWDWETYVRPCAAQFESHVHRNVPIFPAPLSTIWPVWPHYSCPQPCSWLPIYFKSWNLQ